MSSAYGLRIWRTPKEGMCATVCHGAVVNRRTLNESARTNYDNLDLFRPRTNRHLPLITAPNSITLMTTNSSMKRIINHALAALAALMIGVSHFNLNAATFSDDNWISIGNIRKDAPLPVVSGGVGAVATDSSGNLYVGGDFTIAGGVPATNIAKWNGSMWSALGLGMNGSVNALLAVGNELYAGG